MTHRQQFSWKLLLLFIVSAIVAPALGADTSQPKTATGIVFHDANENGVRDAGEEPVAGVYVSNGREVIPSDEAGRYELPIDDDTILFVVKPRGWMTPTDENNIPVFYYIHKPNGSPDKGFRYPGVEPTGPLPESVDFPLTKSADEEEITVIIMGDPQPYDEQQVRYYANDVVAELVGKPARFLLAMGDLVGDDLALFPRLNEVHGTLGYPIYNVIGNHDMNYYAGTDRYAAETYERYYGPANYMFQYGQVHFIVLDNVRWKGHQGDRSRSPDHGNYTGWLNQEQLDLVANYVDTVPKGDRIVICTHIPLPLFGNGQVQHSTPQFKELMQILSGHPNTMSLSGHTHWNQHHFAGSESGYTPEEGTDHHHHNVATGSGSWYRGPHDEQGFPVTPMADGTPNGYIIGTFHDDHYHQRYKAARMPADYQMAIHTPEVVPAGASEDSLVVANVFNGSDKSTVRMRIGLDGEWIEMEQKPQIDPAYATLASRDAATPDNDDPPLPEPIETPHMWQANLPAGLTPGFHLLQVETTDMHGQTEHGQKLVEVR